jgi:hypothetical protein
VSHISPALHCAARFKHRFIAAIAADMKTRPSTFKPDYVRQARELYARGFTDRELAEALGVARDDLSLVCGLS